MPNVDGESDILTNALLGKFNGVSGENACFAFRFGGRPLARHGLGDRFSCLGDRKNGRPNRGTAFRTIKKGPRRALSLLALQRYNKTRRNANRPRMTHNGKIRKKGKWRRVVVPCPLTWHSVLVAAPAATPFLCRRNATVPRVARQWVRPRSSAMSIDVALSTRRGVGRDTYSLPQKRGGAPVPCQWTWHYLAQLQRQKLFSINFQSVFAPLSFQLVEYQ